MNLGKFFAIAQIAISILAAGGYALARDWRHTIYWASAAVLTSAVTW